MHTNINDCTLPLGISVSQMQLSLFKQKITFLQHMVLQMLRELASTCLLPDSVAILKPELRDVSLSFVRDKEAIPHVTESASLF